MPGNKVAEIPGAVAAPGNGRGGKTWAAFALGSLLCVGVTGAAYALRWTLDWRWLSPLILSFLIGAALTAALPAKGDLAQGVGSAGRLLLRAGVALLGLQVALGSLMAAGFAGLVTAVVVVASTLVVAVLLGSALGVERRLVLLLGAGTAICGASAVVATGEVVRARREDVGYALVSITALGKLGMIAFPMLGRWFGLPDQAYGVWTGASLHEVAQVVGAGFAVSPEAGEAATIQKLARVVLLAPALVCLSVIDRRVHRSQAGYAADDQGTTSPVPVYVVIFLLLAGLNSSGLIPTFLSDVSRIVTPALLAAGLAAVGLQTRVKSIVTEGWRSLLLVILVSLWTGVIALSLTRLFFH